MLLELVKLASRRFAARLLTGNGAFQLGDARLVFLQRFRGKRGSGDGFVVGRSCAFDFKLERIGNGIGVDVLGVRAARVRRGKEEDQRSRNAGDCGAKGQYVPMVREVTRHVSCLV